MNTESRRYLINALISIIVLFNSSSAFAEGETFSSPYFMISLNKQLKLISKDENPDHGFYRYVFSSSDSEDTNAKMQMRIIVSGKKPEENQTIEAFNKESLSFMSVMFIDSYKLYPYLEKLENKKVLNEPIGQLKLGDTNFFGFTMYFGEMDASFLVTNYHEMTYAFTLISNDANQETRKSNLDALTQQLSSLKLTNPAKSDWLFSK